MEELVRLSKLMTQRGLCSRREADVYISHGWVKVDGEVIDTLGTKILPSQNIELQNKAAAAQNAKQTIILNKPYGYVSSQPEKEYVAAISLVTLDNYVGAYKPKSLSLHGMAPAGRLDIDSHGLIVFTQDGRVARKLIGPDTVIEKEYIVEVAGEITEPILKTLTHGLELDGKALKPAKVTRLQKNNLRIVLTEGKKRQIRHMIEQVDLEVCKLKRVRIGNVVLEDLPLGKWRFLNEGESF